MLTGEEHSAAQRLLHRGADFGSKQGFVAALGNGLTVQQVTAAIVGSDEYFQNSNVAGTDGSYLSFISRLYNDVLGRTVDSGAQADFLNRAEVQPRAGVANTLDHSVEYQTNLVSSYYTHLLPNHPTPGGSPAS